MSPGKWRPFCLGLNLLNWSSPVSDCLLTSHNIHTNLSYVHTSAERLQNRGFWYSHSATAGMFTHTRSGHGRICHFLRTMMVWSAWFRSRRGKLGVGPISCGAVFAPAPPPLRDRACVNACNDLCWSQFSARPCPHPPAHVWTYLYVSLPRSQWVNLVLSPKHQQVVPVSNPRPQWVNLVSSPKHQQVVPVSNPRPQWVNLASSPKHQQVVPVSNPRPQGVNLVSSPKHQQVVPVSLPRPQWVNFVSSPKHQQVVPVSNPRPQWVNLVSSPKHQWPLLLTWFNFNPSMDK